MLHRRREIKGRENLANLPRRCAKGAQSVRYKSLDLTRREPPPTFKRRPPTRDQRR